jgi:hypothetical protein
MRQQLLRTCDELSQKQAGEIEISHAEGNLPPPSIEELVAVKPKSGRLKVLSNKDCNKIVMLASRMS